MTSAHAHLLLAHEAFEGATVGPSDFVFRARDDVVTPAYVPDRFDVCLSGHIHRRQVLWRARADGSRAPIVYAGSVERTSFAEKDEEKCFTVIELLGDRRGTMRFVRLPARPMFELAGALHDDDALWSELSSLPADAIVRITCGDAQAARLHRDRARFAPSMNVELRLAR